MKPAEDVHELIKKLQVEPSADMDTRIHNHITRALEEWGESKGISWRDSKPNIGRLIMKSKIAQTAAAAVIIVACLTGLILWKGTGADVVLADVLAEIEQVTAYSYQMQSTVKEQQISTESVITVLISNEYGMKMVRNTIDPQSGKITPTLDTYLSHRLNSMTFVNHEENGMCLKLEYDDDKIRFYREECNDPRTIVRQFLSCNHASLGQSVMDGKTVEGFHSKDLAYNGGFYGLADTQGEPETVDVKIWVDVNTFLPVRSEETITMKNGRHIREVSYDFQWNVAVTADDFKPVVPEAYDTMEFVIPEGNEEAAIKGLSLFADLAGTYPTDLNKKRLDREAVRLLQFPLDPEAWKALTEQERNELPAGLITMQYRRT